MALGTHAAVEIGLKAKQNERRQDQNAGGLNYCADGIFDLDVDWSCIGFGLHEQLPNRFLSKPQIGAQLHTGDPPREIGGFHAKRIK